MSIRYEIVQSEFEKLLDTSVKPQVIAKGYIWTEGPVWFRNALYFNDIPNKKMVRWSESLGVQEVISDTDFANGNTVDLSGNMISCEHGKRRLIRRLNPENTTDIEVIVDRFEGKKLNSPNDVVVKSDGTIWFTDPNYGIISDIEGYPAESEIDGCFVFRVDIDGTVTAVVQDFNKPNGLAFSPDESKLYIADSGASSGGSIPKLDYNFPHHIRVFDVENNVLKNSRIFKEISPGVPDGFRVDTKGYIWTSAGDGIHCLNSDAELMGKILLPETTSNCCFGGESGTDLFITSSSHVYCVRTNQKGSESQWR